MYDINANTVTASIKRIVNRHSYFAITLEKDYTPKVLEKMTKEVRDVNGWEVASEEKAKWYSRVFMKPITHYIAELIVYDNGLAHYKITNITDNSDRLVTCSTMGKIFGLSIQNCFVENGDGATYNAILTQALILFNKRPRLAK